jgi:hypothetical protein
MRPDYTTIGIVLAAIFFLLQVALIIITIWQRLRRQPSIDQTLLKYVLKDEFDKHVLKNDAIEDKLFDLQRKATEDIGKEIKSMSSSLTQWQLGVSHQMGRLDGRVDSMEQRSNEQHPQKNHPVVPG